MITKVKPSTMKLLFLSNYFYKKIKTSLSGNFDSEMKKNKTKLQIADIAT